MSYTVLARRYRSSTFDDLVGQDHIAQTLKKAIESDRLAHAYLFCGTRGTGKTSTARILAKCLNCQSSKKPVTEPCGKCDSCQSIARGEDIDVIEIDAASNTGVDNVRDVIISSAYNSPARSRFKIFIIDEVHMLSKSAFNALLKTLEEPPSHVKFILATTEPEKVLPTILSRCQRYDFRNIGTREIADHLKSICKTEKIAADDDALLLIAKAGAGSMRDALSLLDRLLSVGEKKLTVEMIEQLLGLPKSQLIFDLAAAIGGGDTKGALSQTDSIITGGLSVDSLVASLIDHLRNLLILRTCGPDSKLVEVPGLSLKELTKQAEQFDPGALSQDIVILEELRRHVRQSQAGRALLDATLVRMSLADQFASISDLLSRAGGNGAPAPTAAQKKKPGEVTASSPSSGTPGEGRGGGSSPPEFSNVKARTNPLPNPPPDYRGRGQEAPPPLAASQTESPDQPSGSSEDDEDDEDDALPAVGKVWESDGPKVSLATLMAQHTATAATSSPNSEPSNVEPVATADLPAKWQALLAAIAQHGPALTGLLTHGQLVAIDEGRAVIRYSKQHETFVKMLERNGKKDLLRDTLSQVLEQAVGVRFEVAEGEAPVATPTVAPVQTQTAVRRSPVPAAVAQPVVQEVASNTIRITDEIRGKLYESEPLIRALVDQLGANIIKLEE
jgi:DNA polymerase-3 subunit gamma/tau